MKLNLFGPRTASELDRQFSFHKFRKLRLYFAWAIGIYVVFFTQSFDAGFVFGMPVILLGEAVRIWSHGYLRKARKLATSGPYAFVRNPLYVGNFLIGFGFCIIFWQPWMIVLYIAGFYLFYWVTVRGEEQRLLYKFKDQYEAYVKHVPRFIPRLTPCSDQRRSKFTSHRVLGHGEHITFFAIIVLLLFLFLRHEIFQEGHSIAEPNLVFINILIVSTFFILVGSVIQRRFRKNSS